MPVMTRSMAQSGAAADKAALEAAKNHKRKKSTDGRKKEVRFDADASSPAAKKTKCGAKKATKAKSKGKKKRGRPKKTSPQWKSSPQEKISEQTASHIPQTSATSSRTEVSTKQSTSTIPHLLEPSPAANSSSPGEAPPTFPEEDHLTNLSRTLEQLPSPSFHSASTRRPRTSAVPSLPDILEASETSSSPSRPEFQETTPQEVHLTPEIRLRTETFQTPATQRTVVFVKPGNTSVRRSHLQPHERIVQKAATPWNPPPRTPLPSQPTQTQETPQPSYKQPPLDCPQKPEVPKKKVSFHETSDDANYFTAEDEGATKAEWKVPRKATPATDAFKRPAGTPSAFRPTPKQVSFDEDSIGSDRNGDNKSPWVPPRKPTPAKPPPSVSASARMNSTLLTVCPATPTLGRPLKKCISKRLTYSAERSGLLGESGDEEESGLGYEITEFEASVSSSQEEEFKYLKYKRRLNKPIPEWAKGEQLTMALVKMIPLVDVASRQTHIRRVFPPMREGRDIPPPSLYPSVPFAPTESPASGLFGEDSEWTVTEEDALTLSHSLNIPQGHPPTGDSQGTHFIKHNYSF